VEISPKDGAKQVNLTVLSGKLDVSEVVIEGIGKTTLKAARTIQSGESQAFSIKL
jgi:hypothetical protein